MLQSLLRTYGLALARRSLDARADLRLAGLREAVEVVRDEHGVPHIFAGSAHDLFFAQGYVHAEARLWQMDLFRRAASGRLAEVLGDAPVHWEDAGIRWRGYRVPDLDRYLRILGLRRAAELAERNAGGEAREALAAYAAGVNRFVGDLTPKRLPVEMKLLGFEPEAWTPVDSLCISKIMALELSYAIKHKLALVSIADKLAGDPDRLQALLPPGYPKDAPRVVAGWHGAGKQAGRILGADGQFREFVGWAGPHLGSNWCLLGPERTTTGKPLLLNDPHVQLTAPSLFFPNHLSGGPYDVTGVSIPGSPGCALGHTRRIAWGFTNVMADDADLYFEAPHPTDPLRYLVDAPVGTDSSGGASSYARFEIIDSPIRVKGERQERPCAVRVSRHGPIISDAFLTPETTVLGAASGAAKNGGAGAPVAACGFARGPLLALRWTAHLPSGEVDATLGLNRARGWADVLEAARTFVAPAQNICFADVDGNFGYVAAGKFPIRANRKNLLPADGAKGEGEWTGFVPFEENPHVFNPSAGYLVSCNNKLVDDGYPHHLSDFWEPPYRARRYHQLVREKGKVSPQDGEKMMLDVHSLQAEDLVNALIRPIADRLKQADGDVQVAINYLLNWDFGCTTDSIAASVFHVFYDEMMAEVFRGPLGEEVYTQFLEGWNEHVDAVEAVLKDPKSAWFRDRSRDDCVARALARAVRRIEHELGEATQSWSWGRLHTLTLRHAFHAKTALRKLVDVGPVASPGSGTTINNGQWIAAHPFGHLAGAGFRHVADLADLTGNSRFVIPGGVSGNPASPHREDLFKLWLEGKTAPMLMDRAAVERGAKERQRLEPLENF